MYISHRITDEEAPAANQHLTSRKKTPIHGTMRPHPKPNGINTRGEPPRTLKRSSILHYIVQPAPGQRLMHACGIHHLKLFVSMPVAGADPDPQGMPPPTRYARRQGRPLQTEPAAEKPTAERLPEKVLNPPWGYKCQ